MPKSADGWEARRLQFEVRAAPVDDGYGNTVAGEYTPQFEIWGWLKYLRGSETVLASRLEGRSPAIIAVRNSTNARRISNEWRVRDVGNGVLYQVKEPPRPTGQRAYLEMIAESGVAA